MLHATVVGQKGASTTVDVVLTKVTFVPRTKFQDLGGKALLVLRYTATNTGQGTVDPLDVGLQFASLSTKNVRGRTQFYAAGSAIAAEECRGAEDVPFTPGKKISACVLNMFPPGSSYQNFAFLSGDPRSDNYYAAIYRKP